MILVTGATGNVGGVYALTDAKNGRKESGEFVSSVLDAKATATWGAIRWSAEVPADSTLQIQTRSGDTAEPDRTWSASIARSKSSRT